MKVNMKQVFVFAAALLLTACASMITPQSIEERVYVGVEQATAVANTAGTLYDNGTLSRSEYESVLDKLEDANQALTEARKLAEAGDVSDAEERVQLANQLLLTLRNRLKEAQQNE